MTTASTTVNNTHSHHIFSSTRFVFSAPHHHHNNCFFSSKASKTSRSFFEYPLSYVSSCTSTIMKSTRNRARINLALPRNILCLMFEFLSTRELIKCRRVCPYWKLLIEEILFCSRVLSLHLTTTTTSSSNSIETGWQSSTRALYFQENVSIDSTFDPKHRARLCVHERRLYGSFANGIGGIFPNLHSLVVYSDLHDSRTNLIKLLKIIRAFAHVQSFSFVMSNDVNGEILLPTICTEIDAHMRALSRLDLYISDQNYIQPFALQPPFRLDHLLDQLEHFSISCLPQNCFTILSELGREQETVLKSLSFPCRLQLDHIPELFKRNPSLENITRLQLTCVGSLKTVGAFLAHFHQVECLQLAYCRANRATFDSDWILTLEHLEALTELKLFDYSLQFEGTLNGESLPRVTQLTLGSTNLLTINLDLDLFVETNVNAVAHQFPALEVLRIYATVQDARLGDWLRAAVRSVMPKVKLEAHLDCMV